MCIICFDEPPNNKIDHDDHQTVKFGIEHVFENSRERTTDRLPMSVIAMFGVDVSTRFAAKWKEC